MMAKKKSIRDDRAMTRMVGEAKKELATLRRQRTMGYCTPYARIEELEKFISSRGKSHGF
jgi:hypothetical protein